MHAFSQISDVTRLQLMQFGHKWTNFVLEKKTKKYCDKNL